MGGLECIALTVVNPVLGTADLLLHTKAGLFGSDDTEQVAKASLLSVLLLQQAGHPILPHHDDVNLRPVSMNTHT